MTIGATLNRRRTEAGLSMDELARAMGFAGQSSIQRYLTPDYDLELRPRLQRKFDRALEKNGTSDAQKFHEILLPALALAPGARYRLAFLVAESLGYDLRKVDASAIEPIDDPVAYVREILERRGISANKLAENSGITPSTLNRALNDPNHTSVLSTRTLRKIKEWDQTQ